MERGKKRGERRREKERGIEERGGGAICISSEYSHQIAVCTLQRGVSSLSSGSLSSPRKSGLQPCSSESNKTILYITLLLNNCICGIPG